MYYTPRTSITPSTGVIAGAVRANIPTSISQAQYDTTGYRYDFYPTPNDEAGRSFFNNWASGFLTDARADSSHNILLKSTTKEAWISLPYPVDAQTISLAATNCDARLFMTTRSGVVLRVRSVEANARVTYSADKHSQLVLRIYKGTAVGAANLLTGVDINTLLWNINGIPRGGWVIFPIRALPVRGTSAPADRGEASRSVICVIRDGDVLREYTNGGAVIYGPNYNLQPRATAGSVSNLQGIRQGNSFVMPFGLWLTRAQDQPSAVRSNFYWKGTQNKTDISIYREFELNELQPAVGESANKRAVAVLDLPLWDGNVQHVRPQIALVSNTAGSPGQAFDAARGDVLRINSATSSTHVAASSTTGAQPVGDVANLIHRGLAAELHVVGFANRYVATDRDGVIKLRYTLVTSAAIETQTITCNITVRIKAPGGTADPAPCTLDFQYSSPSDYNLDYNQTSFGGPKVNPCPDAHDITYSIVSGPGSISIKEGHTNGSGNPDYDVSTTLNTDESAQIVVRATDSSSRTKDITPQRC